MNYTVIDLEHYPRKAHFELYTHTHDPYAGMTVLVDITGLPELCRQKGWPFSLVFLYCVGRAANAVPQFRHRILNGMPVEFDRCDTSHTVMGEDDTFNFCRLNPMQPFDAYLRESLVRQEQAQKHGSITDPEDAISLFFLSMVPWLRYTDLRQPTPCPADSNPRINWCKYETTGGVTTIPVTVLVHHALVDGIHIAAFYKTLEQNISDFLENNK